MRTFIRAVRLLLGGREADGGETVRSDRLAEPQAGEHPAPVAWSATRREDYVASRKVMRRIAEDMAGKDAGK